MTVKLARAVRLAGASRSAVAVGYNKNVVSCGVIEPMARRLDQVPAAASTGLEQWANHAVGVAGSKSAVS